MGTYPIDIQLSGNGINNYIFTTIAGILTINDTQLTKIVVQPKSVISCTGLLATFEISATGKNLSYNWNNGAITPIFVTSIVGNYIVTISGSCGIAISNTASYNNYLTTKINQQPISSSICGGYFNRFSISSTGSNLNYL